MSEPVRDPWAALRGLTNARIGLARTGNTMASPDILAFQLAHARARHAVTADLDPAQLGLKQEFTTVSSEAASRQDFVRRPDLGRRLLAQDAARLAVGPYDVAFVIADGLSVQAVAHQAAAVLAACRALLDEWSIAPLIVARNARVALGDEIGERLGARCVVVMIGERPGLSVSDSMSLYMTWLPRVGRRDSERNCISNIHSQGGLSPVEAAARLVWLMHGARQLGQSGIMLKDERSATPRIG